MSQLTQIILFNKVLDQFLLYIEDTFPSFSSDILLTKSTISFVRKSNPRLVVEKFNEFVLPYNKQIQDCDEHFFLNFEQNMKLNNDSMLYGLKLKSIWSNISSKDDKEEVLKKKAIIFYYFQKLLKLSYL